MCLLFSFTPCELFYLCANEIQNKGGQDKVEMAKLVNFFNQFWKFFFCPSNAININSNKCDSASHDNGLSCTQGMLSGGRWWKRILTPLNKIAEKIFTVPYLLSVVQNAHKNMIFWNWLVKLTSNIAEGSNLMLHLRIAYTLAPFSSYNLCYGLVLLRLWNSALSVSGVSKWKHCAANIWPSIVMVTHFVQPKMLTNLSPTKEGKCVLPKNYSFIQWIELWSSWKYQDRHKWEMSVWH